MSMADVSHSGELSQWVVASGMVNLAITVRRCHRPVGATWVGRTLLWLVVVVVSDGKGDLGTAVTGCGWAHMVGLWESAAWLGALVGDALRRLVGCDSGDTWGAKGRGRDSTPPSRLETLRE